MAVDPRAGRRLPLQWEDLSTQSRRVVSANVRESGMARTHSQADIDRETAGALDPGRTEERRGKARAKSVSLGAIQEHLVDKPITLQGAAGARSELFRAGEARAQSEGRDLPRGYGWYFQHRADIHQSAQAHGFETEKAVSASAAMSPSNSPENEKAAVGALMKLHAEDPVVGFKPKAQKAMGVPEKARVSELEPEQVAMLGDPKLRQHIDAGDHDLSQVARGGTRGNTAAAVHILRGNKSIGEHLSPLSAAKVTSYEHSIQSALPGATQDEYIGRYRDVQQPAQGRMDLYGLQHSDEGILSPTAHTAEDTWMNAISSRQRLASVPVPTAKPTSPAKIHFSQTREYGLGRTAEIGGAPQKVQEAPSVSGGALRHAFNNKATQMAAQALSRQSPTSLPAVGVQETSWTEARIQADKDPAYRLERQAAVVQARPVAPNRGQPEMFKGY